MINEWAKPSLEGIPELGDFADAHARRGGLPAR